MPSSPASDPPVGVADIEAAARRIAPVALRTPLLENPLLNERLGYRLLVKAECLQRTGSFKIRGAYNRLSQLSDDERRRGVVAFSSGNHAQGVAYAARVVGTPAVIVMPADAPALKIANTRAYGAEVVLYDRQAESREEIGARLSAERGLVLVPPFDDPRIIAGQATVGLEIAAQCRELDVVPDAVLVGCSGGGLAAGTAIVLADRLPGTKLHTVEPEGFDDTRRSLAAGRRVGAPAGARSFCDALLSPLPGEITFPVIRRLAAYGLAVTDAAVEVAMATAFAYLKIVVEPGGAAALAAAMRTEAVPYRAVVAVASGGNVDPALFAGTISQTHPI